MTSCCFYHTGSGNHRYFMGYLFFLLCMICWMIYGCICCESHTSSTLSVCCKSIPRCCVSISISVVYLDWSIHFSTTYSQDGFWLYVLYIYVLHLYVDWRIHCSTSYSQDGFWLYLTQIASCSPWMFWMFLNSVFHFMWVAVLILCQLYQVRSHLLDPTS